MGVKHLTALTALVVVVLHAGVGPGKAERGSSALLASGLIGAWGIFQRREILRRRASSDVAA
jgi:hypothetical protein